MHYGLEKRLLGRGFMMVSLGPSEVPIVFFPARWCVTSLICAILELSCLWSTLMHDLSRGYNGALPISLRNSLRLASILASTGSSAQITVQFVHLQPQDYTCGFFHVEFRPNLVTFNRLDLTKPCGHSFGLAPRTARLAQSAYRPVVNDAVHPFVAALGSRSVTAWLHHHRR